mgnify:CR=1 FL=1
MRHLPYCAAGALRTRSLLCSACLPWLDNASRRASEAARADLLGSEEARQVVIQTLVSSVALGYIDLLNLDRQLQISIDTADTRNDSLEIFTKRHQAGVISNLELSQVKSEYQEARARIPELQRAIGQRENALSVLLGRNPGPIRRGGTIADLKLPRVPAGLPSDLLVRRPDIRQAEQELIAAKQYKRAIDEAKKHLEVNEKSVPAMAAMAVGLQRAGADFLVLPCNTAFAFAPAIRAAVDIPLSGESRQ